MQLSTEKPYIIAAIGFSATFSSNVGLACVVGREVSKQPP